jgi:hypothetical protein
MTTLKSRVARLSVGAFSFLIVAALLLGLYCVLDFHRLKQQRAYPTPEDAFVDMRFVDEVIVESSRRCSVIIGGQEVLPLNDLWFVTGYYSSKGVRKPAGTLVFRVDGGWVRVSETSPTPLVAFAVRKVRQQVELLFDP